MLFILQSHIKQIIMNSDLAFDKKYSELKSYSKLNYSILFLYKYQTPKWF